MFKVVLLSIFVLLALSQAQESSTPRKLTKPLCGLCVNIVKQLDEVLEHGGDIEEAVDKFCKQDVPSFLVDTCEKIIEKNLIDIINKLKQHEEAEKICSDIYLCREE
ncbi:unnamed protein product [Caenorhabditis angaria]|uniref:Saposin B-type domain-containing protein n=1 Tax=Caenorhabditis angaria TaxID=860376 RepID=A0A9P1MXU6_9PELO|nr:unnamed protein product [Caenorhabditis angaria]